MENSLKCLQNQAPNRRLNGKPRKPVIQSVPFAEEMEATAVGCVLSVAESVELNRNAPLLLHPLKPSHLFDLRHQTIFAALMALDSVGRPAAIFHNHQR